MKGVKCFKFFRAYCLLAVLIAIKDEGVLSQAEEKQPMTTTYKVKRDLLDDLLSMVLDDSDDYSDENYLICRNCTVVVNSKPEATVPQPALPGAALPVPSNQSPAMMPALMPAPAPAITAPAPAPAMMGMPPATVQNPAANPMMPQSPPMAG